MSLKFFIQSSISLLIILVSWSVSIIPLNALPLSDAVLVNGLTDDTTILRNIQERIGTIPNVEEDSYTFFKKQDSPPLPKSSPDSKGLLRKLSMVMRGTSIGVDRHASIYQIASHWKEMDIGQNLKQLVKVIILCGSNAKQFTLRVERLSTPNAPFGTILVQKAISVLNDPELTQSERVWVHGLIDSLQLYSSAGVLSSAASSATPTLLRGELEHLRVSGAALQDWIDWLSRNPSLETPPTAIAKKIVESLKRIELLKDIKQNIHMASSKRYLKSIHTLYDDILADTITMSHDQFFLGEVRKTTIGILAGPIPGWSQEISVQILSHFMNYYKGFKSHMENVLSKEKNILSNYMKIKSRHMMDQLDEESEWITLARKYGLWDAGSENDKVFDMFVDEIKEPEIDMRKKSLSYQTLSIIGTYNKKIASKLESRYDQDLDFRRNVLQIWSHLYKELKHEKVSYFSWEHKKFASLDQKSRIEIETAQLIKSWGPNLGLKSLKGQLTNLISGEIQAKESLFYTTTQYLSQGVIYRDLSNPGPKDDLLSKPLERFYVEALAYLVSGDNIFQEKLKDLMSKQSGLKYRLMNQMKKEIESEFVPEDFKKNKIIPFYRWLNKSSIPNPLARFSKSFKNLKTTKTPVSIVRQLTM
ncbi:hypothetical protein DFH28DRAFT_947359 [Melampsora americana]|nr:hypothetical protein DFH28DRAFT_947359 [Melampsora americana]